MYFEYVCNFFGDREVCVLLGDVLRHVTPNRAYLNLQEDLLTMGRFLASKYTDFRHLVSLPVFAKFLQLFQGLPKQQLSKELLITFSKSPADATSDPVSMHTAFTLAKNVHDSLDRWACGSWNRRMYPFIHRRMQHKWMHPFLDAHTADHLILQHRRCLTLCPPHPKSSTVFRLRTTGSRQRSLSPALSAASILGMTSSSTSGIKSCIPPKLSPQVSNCASPLSNIRQTSFLQHLPTFAVMRPRYWTDTHTHSRATVVAFWLIAGGPL